MEKQGSITLWEENEGKILVTDNLREAETLQQRALSQNNGVKK